MAKDSCVIDLPVEEMTCLKTIAQSPWFSVRAEGAFEWLDKKSIRTSTIAIRSSEIVLISCKDIQLPGNHEAFRLGIEKARYTAQGASGIPDTAGSGEWLSRIGLLPKPLNIQLGWNYYDYEIRSRDSARIFAVSVPDTLIVTGTEGRLLVTQHEAPMWLALTADAGRIDEAVGRCERLMQIR